jgi:hypothetical protein
MASKAALVSHEYADALKKSAQTTVDLATKSEGNHRFEDKDVKASTSALAATVSKSLAAVEKSVKAETARPLLQDNQAYSLCRDIARSMRILKRSRREAYALALAEKSGFSKDYGMSFTLKKIGEVTLTPMLDKG